MFILEAFVTVRLIDTHRHEWPLELEHDYTTASFTVEMYAAMFLCSFVFLVTSLQVGSLSFNFEQSVLLQGIYHERSLHLKTHIPLPWPFHLCIAKTQKATRTDEFDRARSESGMNSDCKTKESEKTGKN